MAGDPDLFIGDLTAAVREAEAKVREIRPTFKLFGETFTLLGLPSISGLLQHARAAHEGVDDASPEGLAANLRFIEGCFMPDEAKRFLACLHENRVTAAGYTAVVRGLFEQTTGNPTKSSSGSRGTSKTTSRGSKGGSSRKARSDRTTTDSSVA
ncbi:MAG: hypothetical protein JO222_09280 [Frankiales bacterium]|nr:hypothetical protein [Frankiales bacterium]